ncbi:unnamed protein product, partial [Acanthocheilonema viteae]
MPSGDTFNSKDFSSWAQLTPIKQGNDSQHYQMARRVT